MAARGRRARRKGRQPPNVRGHWYRSHRNGLLAAWPSFLSRHRDVVRALVIYAVSLTILLLLYSWIDGTVVFHRFLEYNAQATGFLAGVFDPRITVASTLVMSDAFTAIIIEECTILAPLAILASAVLAVPAKFSRKVVGIFLGLIALSAVNLVRTTSLFYIASAFPTMLDVAHLLVWQSVMVVLSVAIWLLWMRTSVRHGRP